MSILKLNDEVLIVKDTLNEMEVVKRLASLPSKAVLKFFNKHKIVLPVSFKREAFLETLYETALVKVKDKNIKFEDKVLFEALPSLSVYQLTLMLDKLESEVLNRKYLEELWSLILDYFLEINLEDKVFEEFLYLSDSKIRKESIYQYNLNLFSIFADEKETLEGLSFNNLRLVLYKTISKETLIELGKINGVSISKKLNIKDGIEQLLKSAKHSKPYYKPVDDEAIYEKTLAKVYGMKFKEDALNKDVDVKIIKGLSGIKEEIKAIKDEIVEMQQLEIVLGD